MTISLGMVSSSLLHSLLLAWGTPHPREIAPDSPRFSLPISTRLNRSRPLKFGHRGTERAAFLRNRVQNNHQLLPRGINEPLEDEASLYVATVLIGTPGNSYDLVLDTASCNTWVGGGKPFIVTSSSRPTGSAVRVSLDLDREFLGSEFLDQVSFAGLVMPNKSIGALVSFTNGFAGVDGVLGIGPYELSIGTLQSNLSMGIPNMLQTLSCQGSIQLEAFGIFMQPTTSLNSVNGEITWGGEDTSKVSTPVFSATVPITTTSPALNYWGIDVAFLYGTTPILNVSAGIIDSGSALIYLANDAWIRYIQATGATFDFNTGLLTVPSMDNLQNLVLVLGGEQFPLTPNAQIWPRALNSVIGGNPNQIYLVISGLATSSGQGLDFILGMAFLQRYYTVYFYDLEMFKLTSTPFTNATTN
ncbi:Aspartic proteinase [Mycena venus]|uniref:Aspartic proteinase n=1 Tax=Mycena venus TaxID=2733690 RepID=A0A8H6YGF4_9AGAR|nr:Aspartic proteinase [Mycena venus]